MQKKVSATKMFPLAQSSELGKIVAEELIAIAKSESNKSLSTEYRVVTRRNVIERLLGLYRA